MLLFLFIPPATDLSVIFLYFVKIVDKKNFFSIFYFVFQKEFYGGPEGSKRKNKLKTKKQIQNKKTNSKRENKF